MWKGDVHAMVVEDMREVARRKGCKSPEVDEPFVVGPRPEGRPVVTKRRIVGRRCIDG